VPIPHLAFRAPSLLPPCNTNRVITHSAVPASAAAAAAAADDAVKKRKTISRAAEGQAAQKVSGRQTHRCRGSLHVLRRIPPRLLGIIWDNVKETVTGGHPVPTDPV